MYFMTSFLYIIQLKTPKRRIADISIFDDSQTPAKRSRTATPASDERESTTDTVQFRGMMIDLTNVPTFVRTIVETELGRRHSKLGPNHYKHISISINADGKWAWKCSCGTNRVSSWKVPTTGQISNINKHVETCSGE